MRRVGTGRDAALSIRMIVVLALLAALYGAVGTVAAVGALRGEPAAIVLGAFLVLILLLHLASVDDLVLRQAEARLVDPADEPELVAVVARVAALADIRPPRVATSPLTTPNAFVVGLTRRRGVIVITEGLRRRLGAAELEAVVAHEISHLANGDCAVLTAAAFFRAVAAALGAPKLLDPTFRLGEFDPARGGLAIARFVLAPVRWALLAVATPLTLTLSRYREYVADRGSALLTGRPEFLMSALQKLADPSARIPAADMRVIGSVSAFWIVPARPHRFVLLSDHPPLEKRLARLGSIARAMGRPA